MGALRTNYYTPAPSTHTRRETMAKTYYKSLHLDRRSIVREQEKTRDNTLDVPKLRQTLVQIFSSVATHTRYNTS